MAKSKCVNFSVKLRSYSHPPQVRDLIKKNASLKHHCFTSLKSKFTLIDVIPACTLKRKTAIIGIPFRGTLVPHLRSRVIQRSCKPPFNQELAITLALFVQFFELSSIHCVRRLSSLGNSMNCGLRQGFFWTL